MIVAIFFMIIDRKFMVFFLLMINDRKITMFLLDMITDIRIEPLEAESELKSYSQSYKKKRYVLFLRTIRDVLHISSDNIKTSYRGQLK